jgi:hypothetical protein
MVAYTKGDVYDTVVYVLVRAQGVIPQIVFTAGLEVRGIANVHPGYVDIYETQS